MNETVLESFAKWCRVRGRAERGLVEMLRTAKTFLDYLEEMGQDGFVIGLQDAAKYRDHLRLSGPAGGAKCYHSATINVRLSHLRELYRFLMAENLAPGNPFLEVENLKEGVRGLKNVLSAGDMERLLDEVPLETPDDVRFKVMLEILYGSGIRVSELEGVRRNDVKAQYGYLLIVDAKTRRERKAVLPEYACALVQLYCSATRGSGEEAIFKRGSDRTVNRWLNDRLKRLCKELALPVITCHGFRHSCATHLLRNGADIREVQEILGHVRIKNTEVYTRIYPDDLKRIVQTKHPREMSHEAES